MCKPNSTIKSDFFENSFVMMNLKGLLKESLEEIELLKKEIKRLEEEIKIISVINKEWFTRYK